METRSASFRVESRVESQVFRKMDIVVDIQGFRNAEKKFIPKEVAVVAIDAPIVNHWIMIAPHSFAELPEKIRRENNWLTRNYHGIEWFDGETNWKYFTSQLRQIIKCVRHIYVRGNEKASYLQNLLSRNIYNLEDISPAFKNLTVEEECGHHGFRKKFGIFHCALRNAHKLKSWIVAQNNFDSDGDNIIQTTCSSPEILIVSDDDDDDEDENINAQSNNKIEKKNLHKIERTTINRSTQTDIENLLATQDENKPSKEIIQIIPLVRSSSLQTNGLSRNSASIASARCQTCGSLSCRQITDGVDEVDGHRR